MTMPAPAPSTAPRKRPRSILGVSVAALLGLATALLISSCGSTGAGLIPAGNAGPLQSDFESIAQAAETGDGSCTATRAAIVKTEQDFRALPVSVDSGLRNTLKQGIANLRARALVLCSQPLAQTTTTSAAPKTTATPTTPTVTTPTTTTPTTPTVTTPATTTPAGGGGTAAPNPSETPAGGAPGGGTGAGENNPGGGVPGGETPGRSGEAPGHGAGAQEVAK